LISETDSKIETMPTNRRTSLTRRLPVNVAVIERRIYLIRGQKVMLDSDLAELYGVVTKALNQAVRRNLGRFPGDFMFQLTAEEADSLRSQIVTLKTTGRGRHRKYLPYVFTEQGVAMLSSVLNSEGAIEANIVIMRAFVRLREMMLSNDELNRKINALEQKYDEKFKVVFAALRKLIAAPEKPRREIGFKSRK
jgi:hypothetical protein